MLKFRQLFLVASVVLEMLFVADKTMAQDIRIHTTIRTRDGQTQQIRKSADQSSLMLFHAGKVYDYIEPALEVTVFEPAHGRFTVLNKRRQLRSEVMQDEIRHFLGLAQSEAQGYLTSVKSDSPASLLKSLALLQFQLQPNFFVAFEEKKKQLSLNSPNFSYVANGFTPPLPDLVENYLHVADWTAQFNSVLHPNSLLPAPRMVLNQELRQRGLLPSLVELKVDVVPAIHLVAQHEWTWNLKATDRQMIADWEKLLNDKSLRTLPFPQFQQEVLKTETAGRR